MQRTLTQDILGSENNFVSQNSMYFKMFKIEAHCFKTITHKSDINIYKTFTFDEGKLVCTEGIETKFLRSTVKLKSY